MREEGKVLENINSFLATTHSRDEYIYHCRELIIPAEHEEEEWTKGAYAVFCWAENNGFFEAPASTKYHGASIGGLVKHSLAVVTATVDLCHLWDLWRDDSYDREMFIAAFFHDLCKTKLYKRTQKWRKDENGKWEGYWGFDIDPDIIQVGHGTESLRLIERYYRFENECWAQAVAWHMGMPDSYAESQQYMHAVHQYPEVLALHTADMYAAGVKEI